MAHSTYSRVSLRLLSKRKKYLIFSRNINCLSSMVAVTTVSKSFLIRSSDPTFVSPFKMRFSNNVEGKPLTQENIIIDEILSRKTLTIERLKNLKSQVFSVGGNINENNFDAIFIGLCSSHNAFCIGKSFFHMLHSENKCNLGSIGKFFRLCYDCANDCTENDKKFLVSLSHDLLLKYPILDFRSCENMALGLSITKNWKVGLQLLEMCKFSSIPSTKMYSAIIESAFKNKEFDVGWKLMNEMAENNRRPDVGIYKTWIEASGCTLENFNKILYFIEKYDIHPDEEVTDFLLNTAKKVKRPLKHCGITSVHQRGTCQMCYKQLQPVSVSEEEFTKLKNAFLDPVLIGKDIFLKTKPEEFKSFQKFLINIGKIDVVLDGLNIAYAKHHHSKNKLTAAQLLCDVVRHFVNQSKKVVVLGRNHMQSWPSDKMDYIKRNSDIFLADNVSADDPLLLYAAMSSGLGTYFVSRDQMRGHKFLLKQPELMSIFSRWQQKHQLYFLYVTPKGSVKLADPLPYSLSVQKSPNFSWHIPISSPMDGVPAHLVPRKTRWLCIS